MNIRIPRATGYAPAKYTQFTVATIVHEMFALILFQDTLAKFWASQVPQKSKLNVGVPFYGHTFTLVDSSQAGIGASHSGGGTMAYFEVLFSFVISNLSKES